MSDLSNHALTKHCEYSRTLKSRSTSLQANQTPVSSTPPQRSSTISEHREEAQDRFDESPALSGPRMSALDPELRKRISVTSRNSKSSSTSRLSGMAGRTRRSSSVSKIENFQLSLGPRKLDYIHDSLKPATVVSKLSPS